MNNKKFIRKILVCGFLFAIVVPLLINILFKFDSGIWFLQAEWYAEDALSFYGSILGSAVTVIGVVWTINHERTERKKDNSILYKPILEFVDVNPQTHIACGMREVGLVYSISLRNDWPNNEQLCELFLEQQQQNNPKYVLIFKNVGRGETFNARVDYFKVKSINWEDISDINSNVSANQYVGEIIQDGCFKIRINLPDYLIMPKSLDNQKWFEIVTEISFSYSDMFNRIRYRSLLTLIHKIFVDYEASPAPDIGNDNYHYVKVHYELSAIMPEKMIFSPKENSFVRETKYIPDGDE